MPTPAIAPPPAAPTAETPGALPAPSYKLGDLVATREAYGTGIARLGSVDSRVVALDADVKNSTFSERFEAAHPERFYQCFIAEQVMVGASMGLAARGAMPFPSTFAAFLTRAADFIRMAAISGVNIKLAGSHAGVSIGEDGPSQMALEDFAMTTAQPNFTVLYPCDAVSTEQLIGEMARHHGPVYMRTSRPKTPVIYNNDETFPIGGLKVLRQSADDKATVIGAGVTLFEALKAYDALKAEGIAIRVIDLYSIQPIDAASLIAAGRQTGRLITVEDHYLAGGIGDAVARAVASGGPHRHAPGGARDSAQRQARRARGSLRHLGPFHHRGSPLTLRRRRVERRTHCSELRGQQGVRMSVARSTAGVIGLVLALQAGGGAQPRTPGVQERGVGAGRQAHRRLVSRSHLDHGAGRPSAAGAVDGRLRSGGA